MLHPERGVAGCSEGNEVGTMGGGALGDTAPELEGDVVVVVIVPRMEVVSVAEVAVRVEVEETVDLVVVEDEAVIW